MALLDFARFCTINFAYGIVKCLSDKTFRATLTGSSRFCVISLTYNMIDQSLCPLCLCGSLHPLARSNVS
ncbi:MAG: hypothetical protein EWV92_03300 [Microcystis aeruginosa Ma_MB_S_20031200_S102]|uniref:Uncharacterized protein n=1 Tax=Microcystis aeruginosa Ma_MB_S_20031200_S102 TaxID=2486254 RepID=A0A552F433_MICAE|nr:MAG: hypothetical protein EWV79_00130 [Microcystis aeruginosa Ma_MB_S_20031200_S102D]TRU41467.1 MAG: hypothetical protein EWV92_03300 [Microcystis aeruginosa Ma_MB_S_20031200_S102]